MREWFSPAEYASYQLPGFPQTERGVRKKATTERYKMRTRPGSGGGKEYHISSLPAKTRKALQTILAREVVCNLPAKPNTKQLVRPSQAQNLTGEQASTLEARAAIVQHVNSMAKFRGQSNAIKDFIEYAETGELPEHIMALLPVANNRSGNKKKGAKGGRTVSRRTLYNWISAAKKEGVNALAPQPKDRDWRMPDWVPYFMDYWADPRQPKVTEVLEMLRRDIGGHVELPSYDTARRFLSQKLSLIERNRGRMGPQELKGLKAFTRRDTSELWPGAVYTSDGHTFKARVEHPFHGQPFRPEITLVQDVYTRYIVGWSAGLAENTHGVLEAIASGMVDRKDGRKSALCAVFYSDNGPGFVSDIFTNQSSGFFARWGITHKTSLPYNSQARGMIERLNRTVLHKAAKGLLSYTGQDLDKEARRQMQRVQVSAKRTGAKTPFDVTWDDFIAHIQQHIDDYNNTAHSSLPRLRHPETMRYVHLTPHQMWEKWEAEGGEVEMLDISEAADLIRPYEERTVRRCEVQLPMGRYFSRDLEDYHGKKVMVGYDIHDASRVWVRDTAAQQLIAVADRDGNKVPYFDADTMRSAVSKQQLTLEQRTKGREKRLEAKLEEVRAEAKGPAIEIDALPAPSISEDERVLADEMFKQLEADEVVQETVGGRPVFDNDLQWVKWLHENPEYITEKDRIYLAQCLASQSFKQLLEFEEIDPKQLLDRAA